MTHISRVTERWDSEKYKSTSELIGQDINNLANLGAEYLSPPVGKLYGLGNELSHGFWRSLYRDVFPGDWEVYGHVTTTKMIKLFLKSMLDYGGHFRSYYVNLWGTLLLNRLAISANGADALFSSLKMACPISRTQSLYITQIAPLAVFVLAETQPSIRQTLVEADYLDYGMLSWQPNEVAEILSSFNYWHRLQGIRPSKEERIRGRELASRRQILEALLDSNMLTAKEELALLPAMFRHRMTNRIRHLLPGRVMNAKPLISAAIGSGDAATVQLAIEKAHDPHARNLYMTHMDVPDEPTRAFLLYMCVEIESIINSKEFISNMLDVYDSLECNRVANLLYEMTEAESLSWRDRIFIQTYAGSMRRVVVCLMNS